MLGQWRGICLHGVEHHFAIAEFGHLGNRWLTRIEHRCTTFQHYIDLRAQYVEQAFGRVNIKFGQCGIRIGIGEYRHLAAVVR